MNIEATQAALALIELLQSKHGKLMFHQSGGCCDGSVPMCYALGDFKIGNIDIKVGEIGDCPFYMGKPQYEQWKHTDLIIDAIEGRGSSFSLEIPEGKRFIVRSKICLSE